MRKEKTEKVRAEGKEIIRQERKKGEQRTEEGEGGKKKERGEVLAARKGKKGMREAGI